MFNLKFWRDAADSFLLSVAVVLFMDARSLIEVGSWEQASVVGLALGRSALIAGVSAVAPKLIALRERRRDEAPDVEKMA